MKSPGLFQGTAAYYARYRSRYPAEVVDLLVERFDLNKRTHVMDLGCGTGQLAIPLAARRIPLHAIDPDIDMLFEGLRAERANGGCGIAWYIGSDSTFDQLHLPPLKLCIMGNSFHWMKQDEVLAALDHWIEPLGGLAILGISNGSVWTNSGNGWAPTVKQVVMDFLGPERRAGASTYQDLAERHETVLARSPFIQVERREFTLPEERTVEEIVGLQLSTSYASPAQLGPRIDEFCRVLGERLLELEPSGIFRGTATTELLIATR